MLLPGGSLLTPPAQEGWYRWILPTLMRCVFFLAPTAWTDPRSTRLSLPYLVRFRQCMIEYTSPLNDSRRPLWNALKYSSSFPVIFLSAAQRLVVSDLIAERGDEVRQETWHGEHALFRLWYVWPSLCVRSFFTPIQATCCARQFSVYLLVGRDERLGLRPLAIYLQDETAFPRFLLASSIDPTCDASSRGICHFSQKQLDVTGFSVSAITTCTSRSCSPIRSSSASLIPTSYLSHCSIHQPNPPSHLEHQTIQPSTRTSTE